jgi:hypothetical protein
MIFSVRLDCFLTAVAVSPTLGAAPQGDQLASTARIGLGLFSGRKAAQLVLEAAQQTLCSGGVAPGSLQAGDEGLLLDDDELRHCVTRCQIIPVRHGPTINRKSDLGS